MVLFWSTKICERWDIQGGAPPPVMNGKIIPWKLVRYITNKNHSEMGLMFTKLAFTTWGTSLYDINHLCQKHCLMNHDESWLPPGLGAKTAWDMLMCVTSGTWSQKNLVIKTETTWSGTSWYRSMFFYLHICSSPAIVLPLFALINCWWYRLLLTLFELELLHICPMLSYAFLNCELSSWFEKQNTAQYQRDMAQRLHG